MATIQPRYDFRVPKKIGFHAVGGGSSHYFWVLEIFEELKRRGHEVAFYTRGDSLKFADAYSVEAHQIGGHDNFLVLKPSNDAPRHLQHQHPLPMRFNKNLMPHVLKDYAIECEQLEALFTKDRPDLMLCDMFAVACFDTARIMGIPTIMTSTMTFTKDTRTPYVTPDIPSFQHPTTETMSLWERLQLLFYRQYLPFQLKRLDLPAQQLQREKGLPVTATLYAEDAAHGSMKLINNFFGLEAPRPMGPLVEMVGPFMRKEYPPLTDTLASFLDQHSKVAYVAFGQHAVPTEHDTMWLLQALDSAMENGWIDGVIWTAMDNHPPLPRVLTDTHAVPPKRLVLLDNHPDILITTWAPQFAVLQHPSTYLFVTHGGAASVHEALFAGVRLFVFPFFGDQPLTAHLVQQFNLGSAMHTSGLVYSPENYQVLVTNLAYALTDPDIGVHVQHYARIVQVRAQQAPQRSADLVEEALFGALPDGRLFHRQDVAHRIPWLKRHNYDLLLISLFALASLLFVAQQLSTWLTRPKKVKSL
ncbi:UDP-Glycosyltransferase/glycogen phosphorylase [Hesseltinella vesiculosa]|uniref:UDP-Glycosyltransferase/glycogen phosphorylase n=1 Tax=Hesseltinella vesiculosa TaxID=101127 RepID=A0A1X2G6D2_9FUNG|nr:UDP-Glycosyltransferase/glycogen phosphorylase [Hesseltinella vesiculosa]